IETAIEQNIRGDVELGELSFSLFPSIKVMVAGVKVTPPAPFNQQPLATVKTVEFRMPLRSLLMAPQANILVEDPVIALVSSGSEESNLDATLPEPAPVGRTDKS